jgi:hypothetical protein
MEINKLNTKTYLNILKESINPELSEQFDYNSMREKAAAKADQARETSNALHKKNWKCNEC